MKRHYWIKVQAFDIKGNLIEFDTEGFESPANTENSPYAVIRYREKPIYGVQFHPEVAHTQNGKEIIRNFLFEVSHAEENWRMGDFVKEKVEEL